MRYLFLLWGEEPDFNDIAPEQAAAQYKVWMDYTESLREAGAHVAGEGLAPVASATTLAVKDGQKLVSDGPFAETKEQIGGFYLIDVDDLDAALAWAEKVPSVSFGGSIEVRPVMEYPED
jgi:hypothetical protein